MPEAKDKKHEPPSRYVAVGIKKQKKKTSRHQFLIHFPFALSLPDTCMRVVACMYVHDVKARHFL